MYSCKRNQGSCVIHVVGHFYYRDYSNHTDEGYIIPMGIHKRGMYFSHFFCSHYPHLLDQFNVLYNAVKIFGKIFILFVSKIVKSILYMFME